VISESAVYLFSASSTKPSLQRTTGITEFTVAPSAVLLSKNSLFPTYSRGEFGEGLCRLDLSEQNITPTKLPAVVRESANEGQRTGIMVTREMALMFPIVQRLRADGLFSATTSSGAIKNPVDIETVDALISVKSKYDNRLALSLDEFGSADAEALWILSTPSPSRKKRTAVLVTNAASIDPDLQTVLDFFRIEVRFGNAVTF
jgi:hypothetical protein